MVPREFRRTWCTDKRSFSFLWSIPPEAKDSTVRLILRGNAALIEVLDGTIEVRDSIESLRVGAPKSVAISLREFEATPILMPTLGLTMLVHIIGALPLRSMLKRHSHLSKALRKAEDWPPGAYPLGDHHLTSICRPLEFGHGDLGERVVINHLLNDNFLRFLGSIPRALNRPESQRNKGVSTAKRYRSASPETGKHPASSDFTDYP